MRPSRESQTNHPHNSHASHNSHTPHTPHNSHTPIYDALYSEYRRSFRALPGDRTGEEDLGFTGFATGLHRYQGPGHTSHTGFWRVTSSDSNSAPNSNGRQHTGNHFPAALPPAPRRGF